MQISAIQNATTYSKNKMEKLNDYPIGFSAKNSCDTVTLTKTDKLAFKGFKGAFFGGTAAYAGSIAALIATGGLAAIPITLVALGSLAATGAAAAAGSKIADAASISNDDD